MPDTNKDGAINLEDVKYLLKRDKNTATPLNDNGDFRSDECIKLLKEADIVVTNPPFSLFREYIAQLIEYGKKFLIIGNTNAITYKKVFKLIQDNKVWLGINNGPKTYQVPDYYEQKNIFTDKDGKRYSKMGNTSWFTNLDHAKRHEELILYKQYTPAEYPKYFNYDAINVDKAKNIPMDYDSIIGVPITFLDKHNPDQFEIVGLGIANLGKEIGVRPYTPEHRKYRKEVQRRGTVDGDLYMIKEGVVTVPYARILIKRKK